MQKELDKILKKIFKNHKKIFLDQDNAETIKDWDSLNHLNLILQISKKFSVKFTFNEMLKINNIGQLKKQLKKKIK
jgi:acyl carrier protein